MFPIKSFKQLQVAYVYIRYYDDCMKNPENREKELAAQYKEEVMAEIRKYLKNYHLLAQAGRKENEK